MLKLFFQLIIYIALLLVTYILSTDFLKVGRLAVQVFNPFSPADQNNFLKTV